EGARGGPHGHALARLVLPDRADALLLVRVDAAAGDRRFGHALPAHAPDDARAEREDAERDRHGAEQLRRPALLERAERDAERAARTADEAEEEAEPRSPAAVAEHQPRGAHRGAGGVTSSVPAGVILPVVW